MILIELKDRITWLRKNKMLEQKEAAIEIGIVYETYQKYEYGNHPNRKNIDKIVSYYNCNRAWLLTGSGEPYQEEKSIRNIREKSYPTAIDTSMRNQAVNDILEIFDSGDPILIPAIQANLIAFRRAIERERQFAEIHEENKQIRIENNELKERLKILEEKCNKYDQELEDYKKSSRSDQIREEDPPEERVDIIKRRAM